MGRVSYTPIRKLRIENKENVKKALIYIYMKTDTSSNIYTRAHAHTELL
jgi:hypothetical protein